MEAQQTGRLRTRRTRRRARRFVAGVITLGILVVGALAAADALAARRLVSGIRQDLDVIRQDALSAPVPQTAQILVRATARAGRVRARLGSIPMRLVGEIPIAGRSARAATKLAEAADAALRAASAAFDAARSFAGADGKIRLGLTKGTIDRSRWDVAHRQLGLAQSRAHEAVVTAERAPATWTLPALRQARTEVLDAVQKLKTQVDSARAGAALIPRMLGAVGQRRYLLVFQNLAEARATGGLIGGFAVIETQNGKVTLRAVAPNTDLVRAPQPVEAPAWFAERYDRFEARQLWSNVNVEPDFAVTAPVIARLFAATAKEQVDGVIAIDPLGLQELLVATGPVEGPQGQRLESATIAKLMMSDAYRIFGGARTVERKLFFADAARRIFERVVDGADEGSKERATAESIARAARSRHLLVWSKNKDEQDAVESLDAGGRFWLGGEGFAGLVTQNGAGNKLDYYLQRSIDLDVRLDEHGRADYTMTVELRNDAPSSGLDPQVIGPNMFAPNIKAGENRSYVSIYLPRDADSGEFSVNGTATDHESHQTPGAIILSKYVTIAPGGSVRLAVSWTRHRTLTGKGRMRGFTMTLPKQPGVTSDQVRIDVRGPKGWRMTGLDGSTDQRSFVGGADASLRINVAISRPLWGRIVDIFT